MWEVTAEGDMSEVYRLLQEQFDEKHVPKVQEEFTVRRLDGTEQTFTKERNNPDEVQALQFRLLNQTIQNLDNYLEGNVKVKLSGDEGKMNLEIEQL